MEFTYNLWYDNMKTTELIDIDLCLEDPENPRYISKQELDNLVENIRNNPGLLGARPCFAYLHKGKYYIYSGAQRLKACKILGMKTIPVRVDTDITKGGKINKELKRQRMLTKNEHFGETDYEVLANKAPIEAIQAMKIPVISSYITSIFSGGIDKIEAETREVISEGRTDEDEDGIVGITLELENENYIEFIDIFEEMREGDDTDISEFTINTLRTVWNQ